MTATFGGLFLLLLPSDLILCLRSTAPEIRVELRELFHQVRCKCFVPVSTDLDFAMLAGKGQGCDFLTVG